MIVVRNWRKWDRHHCKPTDYKGVFLFGIIPLFIHAHKIVS